MNGAGVVNPFGGAEAARRYGAGRPSFHPLVLERLGPYLQGTRLGVDVACGTGLSSAALAEVVEQVLAFDVSAAMLKEAQPHSRVRYAVAPAEALPVAAGVADVVTVAQAFHWFDREAFLREVRRVLRPGGVLFLYDFYFLRQMLRVLEFTQFNGRYLRQYPAPPRHRAPFGVAEAR